MKLKLAIKSMWTVRFNIEGYVTSNGKEVIHKGYQVARFILIQFAIINRDGRGAGTGWVEPYLYPYPYPLFEIVPIAIEF